MVGLPGLVAQISGQTFIAFIGLEDAPTWSERGPGTLFMAQLDFH